jgi:hypothetical protein
MKGYEDGPTHLLFFLTSLSLYQRVQSTSNQLPTFHRGVKTNKLCDHCRCIDPLYWQVH